MLTVDNTALVVIDAQGKPAQRPFDNLKRLLRVAAGERFKQIARIVQ